ncbi:carboxylesterase/lipase family protein [Pseudofrankia saprophytica]|uniref:carboxylesterase/lipase family protein n=1 Tax=Pseudofrankia saprophytica TaxID=298655 RepID=UPI000234B9CA|nr:carboxylesterase family protein [Pseudofrankia saprophytica]
MITETASGAVRGAENDGVVSFKGIPYGDDTGGDARFLPPRPAPAWSGVRDCLTYGPSCPQPSSEEVTGASRPIDMERMTGIWNYERQLGEDCLVLNVWAPTGAVGAPGAGARRPVLVWLHGGAFTIGSASWPLYDFTNLARNNDVVMVGVNHRIGALGFLDLSHLGDEFADSANAGMLDIVAALEWVRDNIAAFGGDPSNVTIFGESGGGAKVSVLLAMSAARGLFHRAFAMSGAFLDCMPPAESRELTDLTLQLTGLADVTDDAAVDALRKLDVMTLVNSQLSHPLGLRAITEMRGRFSPARCPSLPRDPVDAIADGSAADVRVALGCTTHELEPFLGTPEVWSADDTFLMGRLRGFLGDDTDHVLTAYRSAQPDDSLVSLYLLIASDHAFRIPTVRIAEALLAGGGLPPYVYLYAFGRRSPDGVVRAGHGSDMWYFFDNVSVGPAFDGPHAAPLVQAMAGSLVALARQGDPNHQGLATWPPYDTTNRPTMIFDVESRVEPDPMGAERRAWQDIVTVGLG